MVLRLHVQQVSWFREPQLAESRLYALVTPHPEQGSFGAGVVDAAGNRYLSLGGCRTVATPSGVDAESLKALQTVIATESVAVS